jgi:hypothetical protein
MNIAHKLNIYMLPCLSQDRLDTIQSWKDSGRFNKELYEKFRVQYQKNQNDPVRQTGICFSYNADSQTLQASSLYIQRLNRFQKWCPSNRLQKSLVS